MIAKPSRWSSCGPPASVKRIYVYDGVKIDQNYRGYPMENIRDMENFGMQSNPKIWAMVEFKNSKENHSACRCPKAACVSTAAILTASSNSPART